MELTEYRDRTIVVGGVYSQDDDGGSVNASVAPVFTSSCIDVEGGRGGAPRGQTSVNLYFVRSDAANTASYPKTLHSDRRVLLRSIQSI